MSSETRKIFTLAFFAISLAEVCVAVSLQMFESTFSLHIDSLHLLAFVAGSVIGAGAVSASVLRFFGGTLCEKAGRKRLLITGVVIFASMLFFVGRTTSLFMMYLLTIIQMGGYSMASTAISVMIVDVVPRESLGKGMGYFGLASSLAGAIGPSLALTAFAMKGAFRTVTAEAAAISALALFIAVFLIRYREPVSSASSSSGFTAGISTFCWASRRDASAAFEAFRYSSCSIRAMVSMTIPMPVEYIGLDISFISVWLRCSLG